MRTVTNKNSSVRQFMIQSLLFCRCGTSVSNIECIQRLMWSSFSTNRNRRDNNCFFVDQYRRRRIVQAAAAKKVGRGFSVLFGGTMKMLTPEADGNSILDGEDVEKKSGRRRSKRLAGLRKDDNDNPETINGFPIGGSDNDEENSLKRNNSGLDKKTKKSKREKSSNEIVTTAGASSSTEQQIKQPWYTFFTKGEDFYDKYMKEEWGFEVSDNDQKMFEKLSLEGAQAGLSWRTILVKREAYRTTFHNFDIPKVARMKTPQDVDAILESKVDRSEDCVVRHRGKIESVINNAQCIMKMKQSEGADITFEGDNTTFSRYLWSFVDHKPILNGWKTLADMPSKTDESEAMSKALKKQGFKFVGPTTCYSLMQSMGFVVDHLRDTPEWNEARKRLQRREGGFQDRSSE